MAPTLATAPPPAKPNPQEFAQGILDASGGNNAEVLDTYCRALFDNGKAPGAIKHLHRTIELTTETRQAEPKAALKS
jgi:hypothetical protein